MKMAFSSDLQKAERLAKVVGVANMMLLAGWFGGQTIRIPVSSRNADHILQKIIGPDGFARLVIAHGGELLMIPECDVTPLRRAGIVWRLTKRGVNAADVATIAGISETTVKALRGTLRLEGYNELADLLPEVTQ